MIGDCDYIVLGIDPGGANGTTAAVWCWDWKLGKGGRWWPQKLEPLDLELEHGLAEHTHPDRINWWIWNKIDDENELEFPHVREDYIGVAIEDVAVWQTSNADVLSTCRQVGALEYAARRVVSDVHRALPATYRPWLLGGKPQGNADGAVDQALLYAYGGKEKAVGGVKCKSCKGHGHAPGDRLVECESCSGVGAAPRGPLYPLWKPRSRQHARAAVAVAVYVYNEELQHESDSPYRRRT